jgi:hypothetical protein
MGLVRLSSLSWPGRLTCAGARCYHSESATVTARVLPPGAILIPVLDGVCWMHALDNTTGQIMDYGVVKCSHVSEQNLNAWMRATNKDKFVEIGKSFRHESDQQ